MLTSDNVCGHDSGLGRFYAISELASVTLTFSNQSTIHTFILL